MVKIGPRETGIGSFKQGLGLSLANEKNGVGRRDPTKDGQSGFLTSAKV
jgi:hypothetical protein